MQQAILGPHSVPLPELAVFNILQSHAMPHQKHTENNEKAHRERHTERGTKREAQRERHTERGTQREARRERHTERHKERHLRINAMLLS